MHCGSTALCDALRTRGLEPSEPLAGVHAALRRGLAPILSTDLSRLP